MGQIEEGGDGISITAVKEVGRRGWLAGCCSIKSHYNYCGRVSECQPKLC